MHDLPINQIIVGDCLEVMRGWPDGCVDFVFADPPYGVGKAEWDSDYPGPFENEIVRLSRGGVAITCGENNIATCINRLGENYRAPLYGWNKNGMTRGPLGYQNVLIAVIAGKVPLGQNFVQFSINDRTRKNHPCPKPVEFIRAIISRFTKEGDTVLDPFLGSGTTAVAAEQTGRKWIGIEIEPKYAEIARQRIAKEQAQGKLFT